MKNIPNNYLQQLILNEIIRLNEIVDEEFDKKAVKRMLNKIVKQAKAFIMLDDLSDEDKLSRLLEFFYQQTNFHCSDVKDDNAKRMFLDFVLTEKDGLPISIAGILLYIAEKVGINMYPIAFPTQLFLRVDLQRKSIFIDPLDGRIYDRQELATLLKGYLGFGSILKVEHLQKVPEDLLIHKIEQIFKNILMQEGHNVEALTLIESLLNDMPEDPYEIRDRGLILASMDCMRAAINDLDYFIQQCPDDPTVQILKAQISHYENKNYLIH